MIVVDLHRIQSYLRVAAPRGREHMAIGPFLATFSRDTANPYLNYAIPDDDASASAADVAALVAAYRERDRKPRLEYIPSIAPAVEPVLIAEGFEVEGRLPLMTYSGVGSSGVPEGVKLVAASSDEELYDVAAVQWEAYEESGEVPQRVVDGLRRTLAAEGLLVLARDEHTREPAGAGLCTGPHNGATELTSIGVREGFRRRGIAAAMTRWLAEEMVAKGVANVFLMAMGTPEARIYTRAGFLECSEVLHISLNKTQRSG
jgi:ribosomal protein S18 acetylase RimI-like enzyme